jgi:DNA invertase Pin-like site-specific DNA recombinase
LWQNLRFSKKSQTERFIMETDSTANTYGYARVSTDDQNEDRQLVALRAAGVMTENIFTDHKSGKDFNRPAWKRLVRKLKPGDLLVVSSIDRFGRNYEEVLSEWRRLVKIRQVHVRVLDMPLLDTTTARGLLAVFIADLVLQILSFVAETEREHIRTRQREGIAAAQARGVKFGRPMIDPPPCFDEVVRRNRSHEITVRTAACLCGMSPTSFWRKCRRST